MTDHPLRPEILVIGAGPGGSATAWALAEMGHDVLMIDRAEFPREKTCGDGLTPKAVCTLDDIGVLPQVEAAGAMRIDHVRITGLFGISAEMPFAAYQPDHPYALVIPRVRLDDILRQHAIRSGAEYAGQLRVERIVLEDDRISRVEAVNRSGPVEIRANQVVIAVGANIGLLKRDGFIRHTPRVIRAARAYYCNVPRTGGYYDFYFDPELIPGYGWIFPAGDGIVNAGIGVLPFFWASRKSTQTLLEEFIRRRAAENVLNGARPLGPAKGYPLRIDFPAQRAAGRNWMLVGEAAGLVNPVSGEGIDLALESGLIAARTLHEDIRAGRGDHLAFQRELWDRFGPMFTGLRVLRDIMLMPLLLDYAIWLMRQHRFLARTVMEITQGIMPPQNIFHPLFILQFFMPITPRLIAEEIGRAHRSRRGGNEYT